MAGYRSVSFAALVMLLGFATGGHAEDWVDTECVTSTCTQLANVDARASAIMREEAMPAITQSFPAIRNGGVVGPSSAPSGCRMPVVWSSLPASNVQQLGVFDVGKIVEFQVPPGTGTISIVQQAVGSPPLTIQFGKPPNATKVKNSAVVTLIKDPSGRVLFDDNAAPPSDLSTAPIVAYTGAGTGVVTIPNTSQALIETKDVGYPSGKWTLQVNDFALECLLPENVAVCSGGTNSDRYDLTVITKPVAGLIGTLDVSIYLATQSLNAAGTVSSASMLRYVQTLGALLGQVGIALGKVTIYDLPPWAKTRFATGVDVTDDGPCSEFGQLLTLSNLGNEISFFFVDSIHGLSGELSAVGLDGGIPGPASFGGTVVSGAVVNASDLNFGVCRSAHFGKCGADELAYVSAHEAGHFMGLFHTSEQYGNNFDTLRDTPECTCSSTCLTAVNASMCAAKKFSLTANQCTQRKSLQCGGGDNLMFWLFDTNVSQGTLSSEQGKVMRANPVVY